MTTARLALYHVLYPRNCSMTGDNVISCAQDELATEYMRHHPEADDAAVQENSRVRSVVHAMDILSDSGSMTFTQGARNLAEGLSE